MVRHYSATQSTDNQNTNQLIDKRVSDNGSQRNTNNETNEKSFEVNSKAKQLCDCVICDPTRGAIIEIDSINI